MRSLPVSSSNVAAVIGRYTTNVDDYAQNDETRAGDNLDDGEDELGLAVAPDAEELDDDEHDQEDGDPDRVVKVSGRLPVLEGEHSGTNLEGQNGEPLDRIIPAHGETPRRADELEKSEVSMC